jgi:hypothetical protein
MEVLIKTICFCAMINALVYAQPPIEHKKDLFTAPKYYIINYSSDPMVLDGEINEAFWNKAQWSESFIDIEGNKKPSPQYNTRVKMLWNDSSLFIAAELEEPNIWATLKQHDEIIYHDNDFEVFIDPDNNTHQYYEVEVNALNTILDLFMPKPYRNDGRADLKWNLRGLRTAIHINGTINNPDDEDTAWTVEMAIPFKGLQRNAETQSPREGSIWRLNFSRVEWDVEMKDGRYIKRKDFKGKPLPEHNWVWSPQGLINMHYPERWGYLVFTKNNDQNDFKIPFEENEKQYLWLIYYKQQDYFKEKKRYATTLKDLELEQFNSLKKNLTLGGNGRIFIATIKSDNGAVWNINEQGLIYQSKNTE